MAIINGVLGVLIFATIIADAASYSTRNFTAAQEARLLRARLKWNAAECTRTGFPPSCTEAQAQTRDPQARVPVDTAAFLDVVLLRALLDIQAQQSGDDREASCTNFRAASQAAKDTMCVALGLTAGCEVCR